jgi:predicted Kef-type K+ transport protein
MSILHSPAFVNSAWMSSVFLLGYFCIRIHMPPMLGFLLAGFLMNFLGLTAGDLPLGQIADLGIIILLFTIGLKLDMKGLAKVEIWGGASLHTLGSTAVMTLLLLAGGALGFRHLVGLSLFHAGLIAFALSFSSTVFAVKVLEEKGEMNAKHGPHGCSLSHSLQGRDTVTLGPRPALVSVGHQTRALTFHRPYGPR